MMHETCRDKPLEKQCGDCLYELAKELQAWKADVENATRAAMDESCDANERHCTCVPLLRVEVRRLRGIVDEQRKAIDGLTNAVKHTEEWEIHDDGCRNIRYDAVDGIDDCDCRMAELQAAVDTAEEAMK